jgi:hypothetical protein
MLNYPCPPVGFQFTEENIEDAKCFYRKWLVDVALYRDEIMIIADGRPMNQYSWINNANLPWTVLDQGHTFTETPLPEGETE